MRSGSAPLHRRAARSRPAHPHQRRAARQQLPAVADRLRRDLGRPTCFWPDFRRRHLLQAIVDYQKRERRYGGVRADPVHREARIPLQSCASHRRRPPSSCRCWSLALFRGPPCAARHRRRRRGRRRSHRVLRGCSRRAASGRLLGLAILLAACLLRRPAPVHRRSARRSAARRSSRSWRCSRRRGEFARACRRPRRHAPRRRVPRARSAGTLAALRTAAARQRRPVASRPAPRHRDDGRHRAYFVGSAFGRHKLAPSISPGQDRRRRRRRARRAACSRRSSCATSACRLSPGARGRSSAALVTVFGTARRSRREPAQALGRGQGLGHALPRPRRDARSPRQFALRRSGALLLFLASLKRRRAARSARESHERPLHPRLDRLDRHEHAA